MISFENTSIAFRSRSDRELKRAHFVFNLIRKQWIVSLGKFFVNVALFIRFPIGWAIRGNVFAHFCGGESIEECEGAANNLAEHRIGTILDFSVEGKENESDLDAALAETLRTVAAAKGNDAIPFCVFKATGMSRTSLLEKVNSGKKLSAKEEAEFQRVKDRIDRICAAAAEADTPVFIDAEESWIQQPIDDIANDMMSKYNRGKVAVFNTIQLYRHDRLQFLRNSLEQAKAGGYTLAVKLVRGAYMEKERERAKEMGYPSPIQPDKESSDKDFDRALEFCLENIDHLHVCAGTHNEHSSKLLSTLMSKKNMAPKDNRVWFAQLYGMSDHISFNLSEAGYNVAKYVPYGPIREVIPYLIRRAEENTSVKGQTSRELDLIRKELSRRKATA